MKALRYLIVAVFLVGVVVGVTTAFGSSGPSNLRCSANTSVSHEQLAQDLLMTQQMATDVGPAMQGAMPAQGMLGRSGDPAYVCALEQHARAVDRMLARTP